MVVLQALSEQGGTDDVGRGTSTPTACALSDLGRGAACRHAAAVRGADDCQLDVVPKLLSCDQDSLHGTDSDNDVGQVLARSRLPISQRRSRSSEGRRAGKERV